MVDRTYIASRPRSCQQSANANSGQVPIVECSRAEQHDDCRRAGAVRTAGWLAPLSVPWLYNIVKASGTKGYGELEALMGFSGRRAIRLKGMWRGPCGCAAAYAECRVGTYAEVLHRRRGAPSMDMPCRNHLIPKQKEEAKYWLLCPNVHFSKPKVSPHHGKKEGSVERSFGYDLNKVSYPC